MQSYCACLSSSSLYIYIEFKQIYITGKNVNASSGRRRSNGFRTSTSTMYIMATAIEYENSKSQNAGQAEYLIVVYFEMIDISPA